MFAAAFSLYPCLHTDEKGAHFQPNHIHTNTCIGCESVEKERVWRLCLLQFLCYHLPLKNFNSNSSSDEIQRHSTLEHSVKCRNCGIQIENTGLNYSKNSALRCLSVSHMHTKYGMPYRNFHSEIILSTLQVGTHIHTHFL